MTAIVMAAEVVVEIMEEAMVATTTTTTMQAPDQIGGKIKLKIFFSDNSQTKTFQKNY